MRRILRDASGQESKYLFIPEGLKMLLATRDQEGFVFWSKPERAFTFPALSAWLVELPDPRTRHGKYRKLELKPAFWRVALNPKRAKFTLSADKVLCAIRTNRWTDPNCLLEIMHQANPESFDFPDTGGRGNHWGDEGWADRKLRKALYRKAHVKKEKEAHVVRCYNCGKYGHSAADCTHVHEFQQKAIDKDIAKKKAKAWSVEDDPELAKARKEEEAHRKKVAEAQSKTVYGRSKARREGKKAEPGAEEKERERDIQMQRAAQQKLLGAAAKESDALRIAGESYEKEIGERGQRVTEQ